MVKKIPRGKLGNAAKYVTRTQAIKRLQLRLAEFRRLCILKGVHPREPKKKFRGQNKTYYHLKDINFLAHEPLLESFRRTAAYERKVRKARARRNFALAKQLSQRAPGYKLDHLVRERYPTFVDAVRDIDDALSMVHLFATLPSDATAAIPADAVHTSRRIVLEWQALICRSSALRKAFISAKGFYFQAEVRGQEVTWLMPHSVAQVLPRDVDFRVMLTFLEFYHTLLQFVLFKLYHDRGIAYPPAVRPEHERAAAELAGVLRELGGAQEAAVKRHSAAAAALTEGEATERRALLASELRAQALPAVPSAQGGVDTAGTALGALNSDSGSDTEVEDGSDDGEAPVEAAAVAAADPKAGADDDDEELGIDSGEEEEDSDDGDIAAARRAAVANSDAAHSSAAAFAADSDAEAEATDEHDEARRAAGGALGASSSDADVCAALFGGAVVWLSREVPREVLMLLVRSFGGTPCWDGDASPYNEADEAITHAIVDRPAQAHKHLARVYVQPQWVFDCVNFRVLVPAAQYAPGRKPPPHLSPFLDYSEEGYVPEYAQKLLSLQAAARAARQRAAGAEVAAPAEIEDAAAADAAVAAAAAEKEAATAELFHSELAAEVGAEAARAPKRSLTVEDEALADSQQKALMTRKNRKMYEGLRRKEAAKAARISELERKRAAASQQA